jgi:hypothetical protein
MGADGLALSPQNGPVATTAPVGSFQVHAHYSESLPSALSRLADAAASPGQAATAATPAATTATTASPTAPAATCASTAPTTSPVSRLYATPKRCVILIVEDVEGRQVDVGNFFLTEEELVMRCGVLHRHIHRRSSSRCGCTAGHCQRHSSETQGRCRSVPAVSL